MFGAKKNAKKVKKVGKMCAGVSRLNAHVLRIWS